MKDILFYIGYIMYKLRDWIKGERLTSELSGNERAVEYLENHSNLIDKCHIFENVNAIHIIEKKLPIHEKIGYFCLHFVTFEFNHHPLNMKLKYDKYLNRNKNAIHFLRNNRQYINYSILCAQEHGIEIVEELIKNNELDKIDWWALSRNPAAIHILNEPAHHIYRYFLGFFFNPRISLKYYNYINWVGLLYNKNAVELVKNNLHIYDKYWHIICQQPHLINIIECNMDKIHWNSLSVNYNAIHILENNLDNVCIYGLRWNKNGFELLLRLNHEFDNDLYYDTNIVFEYFDYCEKNHIHFELIYALCKYGYTEKHMEYLKHNKYILWWCYTYLSMNPNIFEYDYTKMRETSQSLPWYNDIKNNELDKINGV